MTNSLYLVDDFTVQRYFIAFILFGILIAVSYQARHRILWKPAVLEIMAKAICMFVALLPMALFVGNRNLKVGFDTYQYAYNYSDIGTLSFNAAITRYGSIGFFIINKIVSLFHSSYSILFIVISFFTLIPVYYAVDLVAEDAVAFTVGNLCFAFEFVPRMMDQSRQFIAVAFVMLAFSLLNKGKKKTFIVLILLGALFHSSALLFLFFFFLTKEEADYKDELFVIIGMVFITILAQRLTVILMPLLPSHYSYLIQQADLSRSVGWGGILDMLPTVFCLFIYYFIYKKTNNRLDRYYLPLETCAISVIPFRVAGYTSQFILRMFFYGGSVGIILLVKMLSSIHGLNKFFNTILSILCFFLYFYMMYFYLNYSGTLPYAIHN